MPMVSKLKWNIKKDSIELIQRITHVLPIPERVWAKIYSCSIRGAMNILLRFRPQMFQRLPTEMEYSIIQIICHNNMPKSTYCPIILWLLPPRYNDKKPKTTIFTNGNMQISMTTSTEWIVIKNSCINTALILLSCMLNLSGNLQKDIFECRFLDLYIYNRCSCATNAE